MNKSNNYSEFYLNQEVCDEERWATQIYIGILAGMLVVAFYFLISLAVALCRSRKGPTDANCTVQYATVLRGLLVVVIVTINLRLIIDILQLGLGKNGFGSFAAIFISKSALTTLGTACVYAFLWLRQWVLYDQPILKKVKTTTFKIFNILVLILTVTLAAMGPVLEARYVQMELTEDGCMLVRASRWGVALGIYTGFSLAYQLILLGFFIYPVKQTHSHISDEPKSKIAPIVKRCTLAAAACVFNEIVFIAVHNLIERPVMLNTVTMDLKLIVYYICMVASYNDWKVKILLFVSHPERIHSLSRVGTDFRSKLSSAGDVEAKNLKGDI
ncbi:uncharacterized protein LOC120345770 [Styela clava]|uniref:uncharacterized protein LOC120345770 n=1 Tax=Styela clava TaxID=7725 RepID=UPI00193995B1|nr:uncharacterized protein LOC120345770 [Styela clava]